MARDMQATLSHATTMTAATLTQANRTRWRVAVDIEFEVAAADQEAAITRAEELLEVSIAGLRLGESTEVEIVMALPVSVDRE